jgi:transposase-like protein
MKCPRCNSNQTRKNGHHHGKQNYSCKQCGRQFLESYKTRGYSEEVRRLCLKMHASGMSFRAVEQATGISHNAVINWFKQANLALSEASESEESPENDLEETVSKTIKKLFKVTNKQQFYASGNHLLRTAISW